MLDLVDPAIGDGILAQWRDRVERAAGHMGWPGARPTVRRHARGTLLAIAAPEDQLLLATEVNEWALCASLLASDPTRWSGLQQALAAAAAEDEPAAAAGLEPVIEERAAFARFERLGAREALPPLRALLAQAAMHGLRHVLDDSELTLGTGAGGHSFPLPSLPRVDQLPWTTLRDVPTALVTGSNGKTTSVRLLAACARAHGWRAAFNCTDGVFLDDEPLATGDYSGPAGARMVLRDRRAGAAILETARGGILRRGITVSQADTAIVTNVSSDHFGEYGIDDLDGLADVKMSVAAVVAPGGLLVLNADDPLLRARARVLAERFGRRPPLGWFALDAAALDDARARGESTCGVRDGRLRLSHRGSEHDLGLVAAMPLTVGGIAGYNVANLAGAALGAVSLGISAAAIASVFERFGAGLADNPGRMMRFESSGAQVLIDYAHNPEGLQGLLSVADRLRGDSAGRLGLLLGHAGNRRNADIEELARVAARFRPDLVVVKENEAQLRGRAAGEVPQIIRDALLRAGLPAARLPVCGSEFEAACTALDWARPGDILVFPLHSQNARAAVVAMLQDGRRADRPAGTPDDPPGGA